MNRFGLALSGGGFRATIYHLGVVRCLRDAGVLSKITHITTVSGGSVLGAHLALNWEQYCGTPEEFDKAAAEIVRFVQLDVRNRIVRRFPFASVANKARSFLMMRQRRQWTRAGLLERYYERHLFGDTSLSQLPEQPQLHILSTNLSEGCLCSFNRNGMLMQRRVTGRRETFERVEAGLATVPMAVAASSCFPGFFPPLELTDWDVGAEADEFTRQSFTDGGVYDNLGLRMFRHLEQSRFQHGTPLGRNDFLAFEETMSALRAAEGLAEDSPLGQLRKKLDRYVPNFNELSVDATTRKNVDARIVGIWEVIRSEKLYQDPILNKVELDEPSAKSMLNYVMDSGREPEVGDRLWLNRMIVDSAFRQVIGKPCLRTSRKQFKGIFVSDAGGKFKVSHDVRGGGLISTAIRSSDILMDRVWQLEKEVFENTTGTIFIPIVNKVKPSQDPHALDAEVQHQASRIRTDMDRFSALEISTLGQHGYGVARQICRENQDLIGGDVPSGLPWDPKRLIHDTQLVGRHSNDKEESTLSTARRLRKSSKRKILSTLLSLRDWPSYAWLLLAGLLLVGAPYFIIERNKQVQQKDTILSAVAQLNPEYQKIVDLLQNSMNTEFTPMKYESVVFTDEPDYSGFEVLSDSRVFDLRGWSDPNSPTQAIGYTRTQVRRVKDAVNNSHLRLRRDIAVEDYLVNCKPKRLDPQLSRMELGDGLYRWEMSLDLSHVPINSHTDISLQSALPPELASGFSDEGRFNFTVRTKTGLLQIWLLMPEGREYGLFEVSSHPIGHPELTEIVVPTASIRVAIESVATFRLINPEPNRRYECRWIWDNPESK